MSGDWGFAWQVGAVGFALVFVILIALYLALAFIGWLSAKYSRVETKPKSNRATVMTQEKKATQEG